MVNLQETDLSAYCTSWWPEIFWLSVDI